MPEISKKQIGKKTRNFGKTEKRIIVKLRGIKKCISDFKKNIPP